MRLAITADISLGFYFNYAKVPAIILLPIWIGNELYQLFFGGESNIAYVAHIGGLLSGAGLGYIELKFTKLVVEKAFDEDPKEKIPHGILLLGRAYLKQGISEKGKKCLHIVCKKYPGSTESKMAKALLEKG